MEDITVRIFKISDDFNDLPLPSYMTDGSAGMDLFAAVAEPVVIAPMCTSLVPTNLKIELPPGYEAQIRPRSGLALRDRITLPNSPGTIDSDYRGEIRVIMLNLGAEPFVVRRGDRIAQMVVSKYTRVAWKESDNLNETRRGEGGFGSTGK